jgi:hypothetical protein
VEVLPVLRVFLENSNLFMAVIPLAMNVSPENFRIRLVLKIALHAIQASFKLPMGAV